MSGLDGSVLTWTLRSGFIMPARPGGPGNRATLIIEFDVRAANPIPGEEGLVLADRTIEATVEFTPSCAPDERYTRSTGPGLLPLREPIPEIIKPGGISTPDRAPAATRTRSTVTRATT